MRFRSPILALEGLLSTTGAHGGALGLTQNLLKGNTSSNFPAGLQNKEIFEVPFSHLRTQRKCNLKKQEKFLPLQIIQFTGCQNIIFCWYLLNRNNFDNVFTQELPHYTCLFIEVLPVHQPIKYMPRDCRSPLKWWFLKKQKKNGNLLDYI